jgi:hypothetical protein
MIRLKMEQIHRFKDLLLFSEPVEISNRDGNVVGLFVPANSIHQTPPVTSVRTTREVFERLQSLTQDPAQLADLQKHIDVFLERDRSDHQVDLVV